MVQLLSCHKAHLTHHHSGSNSTLGRDCLQPTRSDEYAVGFLRVYTECKLRLVSRNHLFYCTCPIHFTIFSFYYQNNICLWAPVLCKKYVSPTCYNLSFISKYFTTIIIIIITTTTTTTTTPWLYSPCRTLASFTTNFQSSLLCARILQFVTPILLRSSLTSSILHTNILLSNFFWRSKSILPLRY